VSEINIREGKIDFCNYYNREIIDYHSCYRRIDYHSCYKEGRIDSHNCYKEGKIYFVVCNC